MLLYIYLSLNLHGITSFCMHTCIYSYWWPFGNEHVAIIISIPCVHLHVHLHITLHLKEQISHACSNVCFEIIIIIIIAPICMLLLRIILPHHNDIIVAYYYYCRCYICSIAEGWFLTCMHACVWTSSILILLAAREWMILRPFLWQQSVSNRFLSITFTRVRPSIFKLSRFTSFIWATLCYDSRLNCCKCNMVFNWMGVRSRRLCHTFDTRRK